MTHTLALSAAIDAVRKNLDEIGFNESVMYSGDDNDNASLDNTIAKTLPEAVNAVVLEAPAHLLEGDELRKPSETNPDFSVSPVPGESRVIELTIPSKEPLRIVSLRMGDTEHIVTDVVPEASAIGREQLNRYVRGTYDRPVLVQMQGRVKPAVFRYYSLREPYMDTSIVTRFCVFLKQYYIAKSQAVPDPAYDCPLDLRDAIINRLTAMVLAIYGEGERAKYFFDNSITR